MMTTFKILSAAAMLSLAISNQVLAQAAIQEPGAFAFYHPNADVLNGARPTPAATAGASVSFGGSNAYASVNNSANASACAQRYRSFDPASGSYLGRDGNRHRCR